MLGLYIGLPIGIVLLVCIVLFFYIKKNYQRVKPKDDNKIEVNKAELETLANYIKQQKEQEETERQLKELKKIEQKQKLEVFKQTKESLRQTLQNQIEKKQWQPLNNILNTIDKGGMGLYVIYNATKNKYYVGQAKQIFKRIKEHFKVEEIAKDFLSGDKMQVKILTANELDNDYRIDHIEKTTIEIFESDKTGYNKNTGII